MANEITLKALQDASVDAKSLEEVVNGNETKQVTTRLGESYPSVKKAIKTLFENGGLPAAPFKDYNTMVASSLPDDSYAVVTESPQPEYNGLYIKINGAWVRSGYDTFTQSVVATNNAIDSLKSTLIKNSSNLFNADDTKSGYIDVDGKTVKQSNGFNYSGYIAVKPSTNYTVSRSKVQGATTQSFSRVLFYDYNKAFISSKVFTHSPSNGVFSETFATPSNSFYIILNISGGDPKLYERMLNNGSSALPYEPYYVQMQDIKISDKTKADISNIVADGFSEYIDESYNLYDYTDVKLGYYIDENGVEQKDSSQTYAVTDFIPVESGRYTYVGDKGYDTFIHTSVYNKDKQFIKRVLTSGLTGWRSIQFGGDEAYIRLNVNSGLPQQRNRMLIKGADPKPYMTHRDMLKNVSFDDGILDELHDRNGYNLVRYDTDISGTFSTTKTEGWSGFEENESNPNNWRFNSTDDVYALYNALYEQHKPYISKKELGKDANGTSIYSYTFAPERPATFKRTKYPTIAIICGLHGYEHVSPLATYLMLEQMCNNWQSSPQLEALRWNVEFVIVPVAVPHGWDNRVRGNPNGVDINRNFPHNWEFGDNDTNSPYYRGVSAASELETQYLMALINDKSIIFDAFFDFHNFGGTATERRYIWVSSEEPTNQTIQRLGQSLVGRMSRKFHKEHSFLAANNAPTMLGNANSSYFPVGGVSSDYAYQQGIKLSCTFELCERWWVDPNSVRYDAIHTKTMMESITNWVLINLEELRDSCRLQ